MKQGNQIPQTSLKSTISVTTPSALPKKVKLPNFDRELLTMPDNKHDGIYIPWDWNTHSYNAKGVDLSLVKNMISQEDLKKVLAELGKMHHLRPNTIKCWYWSLPLYVLLILGALAAIIVLSYTGPSVEIMTKHGRSWVIIVACISAVILLLIGYIFIMRVSVCLRRIRRKHRAKEANSWAHRVNAEVLKGKCISARMSKHGSYIALEFDGTNSDPTSRDSILRGFSMPSPTRPGPRAVKQMDPIRETTHIIEDNSKTELKKSVNDIRNAGDIAVDLREI